MSPEDLDLTIPIFESLLESQVGESFLHGFRDGVGKVISVEAGKGVPDG